MNESNNDTTALNLPAISEQRAISSALSVDEILRRKQLINNVMTKVMVEGTHYGPGFPGDDKKSLLKPGAEVLLSVFQLVPTYTIDERSYEGAHREYSVTTHIKNYAGMVIGEGHGTAATLETKHRYRFGKPKCASCGAEALMRSKFEPGWYCNTKAGGCGAKFAPDAVQPVGKVENPDPADCWNTCLKMGCKRALVHATITALGVSDIFAQDAEDLASKIDDEPGAGPAPRQDPPQDPPHGNAGAGAPPPASPKPGPNTPKASAAKPDAKPAAKAGPPTPQQIAARALAAESKELAALIWSSYKDSEIVERMGKALALVKEIDGIIPPPATRRLIGRAIVKFKTAPEVINALGRTTDGEVDEDLFDPIEQTTAERATASGEGAPF